MIVLLSSCSPQRTDHVPEPAPVNDTVSTPSVEARCGSNIIVKDSGSDYGKKPGNTDENMTASKYANFEDTIDNLISLIGY